MPELSVVIVNYNTRDFLRACLKSLQEQPCPVEVIVVDNNSQDGSAEMVAAEFDEVRLLAQSENTWFCGGNNIGIRAATCNYVLLLNPDTVIMDDALIQMTDFIRQNPDYAGVTAHMIYPDGETQQTCSRIPTYPYLLLRHSPLQWILPGRKKALDAQHWYSEWQRDSDKDVRVVPGSCTLMRRADILLDEALWLYYPEDDLARRTGRPFRFLADAMIEHYENSATTSWRATEIYFRDMMIYTRKHHGRGRMGLLWLASRPILWGMGLKRWLTSTEHS
ncbi:MAG: glycosyltransferase family 2 protein [Aggregatilineales bacterium]